MVQGGAAAVSYERGSPAACSARRPTGVPHLQENAPPLDPTVYRRTMPRVLGWSQGGGGLLMSEVPLYLCSKYRVSRDCRSPARLPQTSTCIHLTFNTHLHTSIRISGVAHSPAALLSYYNPQSLYSNPLALSHYLSFDLTTTNSLFRSHTLALSLSTNTPRLPHSSPSRPPPTARADSSTRQTLHRGTSPIRKRSPP